MRASPFQAAPAVRSMSNVSYSTELWRDGRRAHKNATLLQRAGAETHWMCATWAAVMRGIGLACPCAGRFIIQRRLSMSKVLGIALALVLALSGVAMAGDVEGKVQSMDANDRMVTLEDGTKLWIAEGVSIEGLKEGAKVKASFEERDGKNVATSVQVSE